MLYTTESGLVVEVVRVQASGDGWHEPYEPAHWEIYADLTDSERTDIERELDGRVTCADC